MFRYILLLLMVASSALFKEIECFFGGSSYRLKTTGARAPIHVAEQVNHNRAILSQLSQQDSRAWRRHASARRLFNNSPRLDEGEEEEEEEGEEESSTTEGAEDTPMVSDEMSLFKEGIKFPTNLNGSDVRVGIIMARWNADIIQGLYKGVNESLTACGVLPSNVFSTYVPGAFELPITARFLAASKRVDVVICLGCLIKGETMHFEYIAQATANGIMQVSLDSYVPCIFGVLTVLNKEQAIARSTGTGNEGLSWGKSAVEMGLARMSALGMGKQQQQKASAQTPFVNFNATMPVAPEKNVTKAKPFGF